MKINSFTPDNIFFEELISLFDNPPKAIFHLTDDDMANIKRCKDITVFEAYNDSTPEQGPEFLENFIADIKARVEGKQFEHVLICIGFDQVVPIMGDIFVYMHDLYSFFKENAEVTCGIYIDNEEPLRFIVAVGKDYV